MTIQRVAIRHRDGAVDAGYALVCKGLALHQYHPRAHEEHLYFHSWAIIHAATGIAFEQLPVSDENRRKAQWMFRCLAQTPWAEQTAVQLYMNQREVLALINRLHRRWRRKEGRQ